MKKVTKTLTGGLAAVMASGMVPMTAMAATNFDELHKAAYDAVKVAQETKTQADINAARKVVADYRTAIEAEGKDGLLVNINTFSELLDGVQQPILSDIVNKIVAMKEAGEATQAEINAVRELVDALPESLQNAVNTWSSEVDKFQNDIMEAAIDAVKTAEAEKTQEAVDAAKVLVEELATSVRPAIQKVAADLQERLDAVEVATLKITSLNVVKDGVEVEFEALADTIKDVEIEVVDNNGKTVAVEKVAKIIEGKSKQKFTFSKIYATSNEKIEGTWTVNGVKVDMTEKKLVNAVLTGKNADNILTIRAEALVLLQNKGYISRLAGSYKTEGLQTGNFIFDSLLNKDGESKSADQLYLDKLAEVNAETPIKNATGIQEVVDLVNEEAGIVATEAERVELIKKSADKPVQFFNALNAEGIERVNESWIANSTYEGVSINSYNNSELQSAKTLEDIQKAIDNQNVKNVRDMEAKLKTGMSDLKLYLNLDKVTEVLDLAKEFINPELKDNKDDKETILEKLTASLNEQIALINVINCDNTSALKAALNKLSVASEDFDYSKKVYEEHMLEYLNKIVDANGQILITPASVSDFVKNVIDVVNSEQITNTLNEIQNIYLNTTNFNQGKLTSNAKAKLMKVFETLESNTRLEANDVNETTGKVNSYNKFDKSIVVEDNLDAYEVKKILTVDELVKTIINVNNVVAGNTVTNALDEVNTAANDEGKDLYAKLSASVLSGKVKGLVEANKDAYAKDSTMFVKAGENDTAYIAKINRAIETVNARAEMLNAKSVSEMASGLKKFVVLVDGVNNVIDIQSDVAEELFKYKSGSYGTVEGFSLVTVEDSKTAIDTVLNKRSEKLNAINNSLVYDKDAATVTGKSLDIAKALYAIDSTYSVADLAAKAQVFVDNSTVKNSNGVVTGNVSYTSYAQVRVAIEKMMK